MSRLISVAATTLLAALPVGTARAQALASPLGTVSQKIDSTVITVEYFRPSARGRKIFGGVVHWGETWTPGANWATTLEVTHDVRIEGQPLPRGKYSLWMIVAQKPDSWTVVLSRSFRRFHVLRPDRKDDELRIRLLPDSAHHLEVATFSFPVVSRTGATLAFQWAGTLLPLRIETRSSRPAIAAAHPWSSYAGVYELRGDGGSAAPIRYEIIARENGLWVRTTEDAAEAGLDPEFDLIPAGRDDFHPRQYKNGKLIGVETDMLIVFRLESGRAVGFELRGVAEDKVLARARLTGAGSSPFH